MGLKAAHELWNRGGAGSGGSWRGGRARPFPSWQIRGHRDGRRPSRSHVCGRAPWLEGVNWGHSSQGVLGAPRLPDSNQRPDMVQRYHWRRRPTHFSNYQCGTYGESRELGRINTACSPLLWYMGGTRQVGMLPEHRGGREAHLQAGGSPEKR